MDNENALKIANSLGTKVEIKNLNSFRAMERAVEYEIRRQTELLERGETVPQETRGWDEAKQATFSQRSKEGSADYRYFPDPDLPGLKLSELDAFSASNLRKEMPELPWQRRNRYVALGLNSDDAEAFVRDVSLGDFFDEVAKEYDAESAKLASNYIANDLVNLVDTLSHSQSSSRDTGTPETESMDISPISASNFRKLIDMIRSKQISSRSAKDLLAMMISDGRAPEALAEEHGLIQKTDAESLAGTVETVLARNPAVVADFKAGKAAALEFLLGQCMKALRGAGDPVVLRRMLKERMT